VLAAFALAAKTLLMALTVVAMASAMMLLVASAEVVLGPAIKLPQQYW
jgi:hypothetical protein